MWASQNRMLQPRGCFDPAPYGPELIVNGGFADASSWSIEDYGSGTNWSITGGKLVGSGTGQNFLSTAQSIVGLEDGATYRVTMDVVHTNGTGKIFLGSNGDASAIQAVVSATGFLAFQGVRVAGQQTYLWIRGDPVWTGTIDNVSVKKVL